MSDGLSVTETIRALAGKGIGRRRVEATLRRKLTEDELGEFYRAQTVRQLRIEQKKAAGPKSTAERVREFVARGNEIGDFNIKRLDLNTEMTKDDKDAEKLKELDSDMPDNLAVFLIDINGLKSVNDTDGHEAGDELIAGGNVFLHSIT